MCFAHLLQCPSLNTFVIIFNSAFLGSAETNLKLDYEDRWPLTKADLSFLLSRF